MKKVALFMPILIVLLLSFSLPVLAADAAPAKLKVAILPFQLNAPGDLSYLKAGVEAMLASRLSAREGVTVIDHSSVSQVLQETGSVVPAVVGPRLEADLVLTGSITALGQAVSIDARGVRLKGEPAEERFYVTAKSPGEVIGAVDQLVVDIGRWLAKGGNKGQGSEGRAATAKGRGEPETREAETQENPLEHSLHPDRLFQPVGKPVPAGTVPPSISAMPPQAATVKPVGQPVGQPAGQPVGQPVGQPGGAAAGALGALHMIEHSQFLDMEIQSLDVGDVFGDGSEVLVIAEEHHIHIYRQNGSRLVAAGNLPDPPAYVRVVEVSVSDLNGNGKAEIYVSAISDNQPVSYGYEWNGKQFAPLFEKQYWHVRTLKLPGHGMVLAGQQGTATSPVADGVYVLTLQDGKLKAGEKLPLPPNVNLFDFVMADFNGDGKTEVAAVDQDNDLTLYDSGGQVLWHGTEKYAYTVRFIGAASGSISKKANLNVPSRLIAADVNGDGRSDLVVMQDPSSLTSLLKTIGSFTGGEVQFLAWNGISFVKVWSSGAIGSYLASYQLGPAPSGGSALYLGLISKKTGLNLFGYQSLVATYPLRKMGQKQP